MGHNGADTAPVGRRPPGGPEKGDRRRQAIVDAVESLLHERTIAELSVESIAAQAGISRSGFYFYFESKYTALGAALARVADEINAAAENFFAIHDDPPEEYFPTAQETVADRWLHHGDLMGAVVDAAHSDDGAHALWSEWLQGFVDGTAQRIDAGVRSGEITLGRSGPRDLANVLVLMSQMTYYDLWRRRTTDDERRARVDALNDVWLTTLWGVKGRSG